MDMRGGIDLGGTKIQAVAAEMVETLLEATKRADVAPSELHGVGVGSPGAVDEKAGTVAHARNLPMWEEPFALADVLARSIGAPVAIGNDVQVAVDAEFELGAGRPYS